MDLFQTGGLLEDDGKNYYPRAGVGASVLLVWLGVPSVPRVKKTQVS